MERMIRLELFLKEQEPIQANVRKYSQLRVHIMNICKNDLEAWFSIPDNDTDKLNLIISLYIELYKRKILANIYI